MVSVDLEYWIEWKTTCAAENCSPDACDALRRFASARFGTFLNRYARLAALKVADKPARKLTPREAWHLFETHAAIHTTRRGKRYKDWLFARAHASDAPPLDAVQGGATLLIRDAARDFLRRELPVKQTVSLQDPAVGSEEDVLSIAELLPGRPDPAQEADRRECEGIAAQHARRFFGAMSRAERVALLAKEAGLSLAHPAVERAGGCKKTALNNAFHRCFARMAEEMRAAYPDDDGESVLALTLMVLAALKKLAKDWGRAENGCPEIFSIYGGTS